MTGPQDATAAAAIASALTAAAADSTAHRRLYLRSHYAVTPTAVFAALEAGLSQHVTVGAGRTLAALPASNALLIPYLVDDGRSGGNRGLRGYAGTLRTDFTEHAAPGTPHVLLVLDENPFETVLTAAQDAAGLPQLQWRQLVQQIAQGASGPAAPLVATVANDLAVIPEALREGALLDRFAAFTQAPWHSTEEMALRSCGLGPYLADEAPTASRLQQSREWRHWLQTWSRPDRDLAAELVRYAA